MTLMTGRTMHIAIIIIALMTFFQFHPPAAESAGIDWYSHEKGLVLGKSQAKKVFINFYATWCGYCKMMDTKTFTDSSVIAYMKNNFIAVKVDVDKERQVAAMYNISPLPDVWFISEKGAPIGNKPGYIPTKDMLQVLKFIHTDSYLKMSFMQFLDTQ